MVTGVQTCALPIPLVTVKVGGVSLVIKALGITHYNPDQVVYLSIDLAKINVFDKKSTNLIKYSV